MSCLRARAPEFIMSRVLRFSSHVVHAVSKTGDCAPSQQQHLFISYVYCVTAKSVRLSDAEALASVKGCFAAPGCAVVCGSVALLNAFTLFLISPIFLATQSRRSIF